MAELCSIRAGYAEEFAEIRWKVGGRSGISEAQGHGAVIAAFVLTTLERGEMVETVFRGSSKLCKTPNPGACLGCKERDRLTEVGSLTQRSYNLPVNGLARR